MKVVGVNNYYYISIFCNFLVFVLIRNVYCVICLSEDDFQILVLKVCIGQCCSYQVNFYSLF